jgi:hypothetical protein
MLSETRLNVNYNKDRQTSKNNLYIYELEILESAEETKRKNIFTQPKPSKVINVRRNKLRGLSPRTNYTDRMTAACRRG